MLLLCRARLGERLFGLRRRSCRSDGRRRTGNDAGRFPLRLGLLERLVQLVARTRARRHHFRLDARVDGAHSLLHRAERIRVLDGAELGRQSRADAAQEAGRLFRGRLERRLRLLVHFASGVHVAITMR